MKKISKKIFIVFIIIFLANMIVYADDEVSENTYSIEDLSVLTSTDISDIPNINARHAIVFDRASKKTIFGKQETEKCKMASTTKIMTAIVVLENSSLDDIVKVSKKSARYRWISIRVIHK